MTRRTAIDGHANRGRNLEEFVAATNEQYRSRGVALIQKVPTPIRVLGRKGATFTAVYAEKSTVDFIGVWWRDSRQAKGVPVAFDVKSTREKTRWPLDKIEPHQVQFLSDWQACAGLSFVLVEFALHDQRFILPTDVLRGIQAAGARSIGIDVFRSLCQECRLGARGFYLDYLGALERSTPREEEAC